MIEYGMREMDFKMVGCARAFAGDTETKLDEPVLEKRHPYSINTVCMYHICLYVIYMSYCP